MSEHTELEASKSSQHDFFPSEVAGASRDSRPATSLLSAVAVRKAKAKAKTPRKPRAPRKKEPSANDDLTVYRLYRRLASPGLSGKDWAIGVSDEGTIRIRLGLTGGTARLEEWPTKFFTDANAEIEKRTAAKLTQGYVLVGDTVVKRGRLEPKPADPSAA